jgi:DNA-binding CsgD family transcriptional regulator
VVAEVLRAAATAAFSQGAPDTAAQYLRRALAEPPDETVRARMLLELGRAEASTVHPDAPANLAEAFAVATDPATRADAAIQGARTLIIAGRIDEALAMLAAFADEMARHDPGRALELEAALAALATWDLLAAAPHRPRLERVDEDMAADSLGARMMLCQLAYQRTWRSQDATRASELVERALADGLLMIERGPEAPELASAAMTLICGDRLEPAAALLDGALEQAREQGSRYGFANVSFLRSELAYRQGALADAEADAHASLAVFGGRAGTQIGGFAVASGMLITALLERGELDEATCASDEAAKALGALGLASDELPPLGIFNLFLSARGRLRLALGDLAGGLHDLHECGRRNAILEIRNPVLIPWRVDAALAHRARGELDSARALSEEEFAAARDWGTPGTIGVAQRVAGLLAHGDEAITLLQEATAALAVSPARLEHARALIDLGAALRRANRRAEAREQLTRGLDLADKCGANMLCRRALDELAATGAHPRHRRLTGIDALTASERRVAQMAARGLGNIEIAQTLFVTRKTVEKHLSNAYTKLGVNSRASLTAHFPE